MGKSSFGLLALFGALGKLSSLIKDLGSTELLLLGHYLSLREAAV